MTIHPMTDEGEAMTETTTITQRVVIDLEDDEQIDRLVSLKYWGHKLTSEVVRAVLREFAEDGCSR